MFNTLIRAFTNNIQLVRILSERFDCLLYRLFCPIVLMMAIIPFSGFGNDDSDERACDDILEATNPENNIYVRAIGNNQTIPLATASLPMNAESIVKANAISQWLPRERNSHILDVSQHHGKLSEALTHYYQNTTNIALNAFRAASEALSPEDTVIFDSVASEVSSAADSGLSNLVALLQKARQNLRQGGRIIIYDYLRPLESERLVLLKLKQSKVLPKRMFGEFLKHFGSKGINTRESHWNGDSIYFTNLATAHEYLLRLATVNSDDFERESILAPWTKSQLESAMEMAGLKLIHSEAFLSAWNIEHFYKNIVEIFNPATGAVIPYPNQRILLVGELASEGH